MAVIKSGIIGKICQTMPNLSEKNTADAVNEIIEQMTEKLCDKQRIEIRGFGSFQLNFRKPRKAHDPKTGSELFTELTYSPHFKPGKLLKKRVDDSKARVQIRDNFQETTKAEDEESEEND